MRLIMPSCTCGFTLIEFMVSMVISLFSIAIITSIYVSGLVTDAKSIKFGRLTEEVSTITTLLTQDIKRAGYVNNAHINLAGAVTGCGGGTCSDEAFRTIVTNQFDTDEPANSCITYAYDEDGNGVISDDNAMGYRLHDGAIEVRKDSISCTDGGWVDITDTKFVHISDLEFMITAEGCTVAGGVETCAPAQGELADACTKAGTTLTCSPAAGERYGVSVALSFNATLVESSCTLDKDLAEGEDSDPDCITLSVNETLVIRNAIYN